MNPALRRITAILKFITALLAFLGVLDQQNCPSKVKRWWTGEKSVEIERYHSDLVDCAFDDLATVNGRVAGFANMLEFLRSPAVLIGSARKDAMRQYAAGAAAPSAAPVMQPTLLAFDREGYNVTFRVGRARPPEHGSFTYEVACSPEGRRREHRDRELACDADFDTALQRQLRPYAGALLSYSYVRDFRAQRLVLDFEFCADMLEEAGTW